MSFGGPATPPTPAAAPPPPPVFGQQTPNAPKKNASPQTFAPTLLGGAQPAQTGQKTLLGQ